MADNEGRHYPRRPVVGVGAVIFDADRVALVKRAHEPLKGRWSLPGGAVDVGESLEDAVVREVFEETGLTVAVGPVIDVVERVERDVDGRVEYHFVIVDYYCVLSGGLLASGSDALDARFVPVDDLARHGVSEKAVRVIEKGYGLVCQRPSA
jgi:ADP-ribose pyrophosphatase YjhB (NUDIX family)